MPEADDQRPNVDELVAELRRTVEERYRSGEYPPELEPDLARHFEVVSSGATKRLSELTSLQSRLDRAAEFSPQRISYRSSLFLGRPVHRLIGKVVRRQTEGILLQMREYASVLRLLLLAISDRAEGGATRDRTRLDGLMDLTARRVRLLGRAPAAASSESLETGPSQEAPSASRQPTPEDEPAGTESLADRLRGCAPVVDLDCAGGEMLGALRRREIEAVGVDPDPNLVAVLAERGLRAVVGDSLVYLESLDDASLGGIVARHGGEQGGPDRLLELVGLASRKLRGEGRLIIEIFNRPAAPDPDGAAPALPLPADLLTAVVEHAGFAATEVAWRPAPSGYEHLERVPDSVELAPELREVLNRNWERLDRLVPRAQDFALIATR